MRTRVKLAVAGSVAVALLSAVAGVAAGAGPRHDDAETARHATRQFHNVDNAVKAHYGEFTDVNGVTCIDGPPGVGNMGIHYVNGDLVGDGKIDASKPEAVLYEHTKDGLKLTAVEYIVVKSAWTGAHRPELFGVPFMKINAPNRFGLPTFYALHAWIWKDNPSGRLQPWNPDVKCPPASTSAGSQASIR